MSESMLESDNEFQESGQMQSTTVNISRTFCKSVVTQARTLYFRGATLITPSVRLPAGYMMDTLNKLSTLGDWRNVSPGKLCNIREYYTAAALCVLTMAANMKNDRHSMVMICGKAFNMYKAKDDQEHFYAKPQVDNASTIVGYINAGYSDIVFSYTPLSLKKEIANPKLMPIRRYQTVAPGEMVLFLDKPALKIEIREGSCHLITMGWKFGQKSDTENKNIPNAETIIEALDVNIDVENGKENERPSTQQQALYTSLMSTFRLCNLFDGKVFTATEYSLVEMTSLAEPELGKATGSKYPIMGNMKCTREYLRTLLLPGVVREIDSGINRIMGREKPERAKSERTKSVKTKSEKTKSEKTKSEKTKSGKTKSGKTKSEKTKSEKSVKTSQSRKRNTADSAVQQNPRAKKAARI